MTRPCSSSLPEVDDDCLKVCVLFDHDASARSAERMIRRVAKTTKLGLTFLKLEQIVPSSNGGTPATPPLEAELFVVAMSHGDGLPASAKVWMERWASLRDVGNDCALVAFVTNGTSRLDSCTPLVKFLGTIAHAHGMTFFYGKSRDLVETDSPQPQGTSTGGSEWQQTAITLDREGECRAEAGAAESMPNGFTRVTGTNRDSSLLV